MAPSASKLKKKTPKKYQPRRQYTQQALESALKDVEDGMSLRAASRTHNIPLSTLIFRKSPKFRKAGSGPSTILTKEEEALLVNWTLECARKGFPRRSLELQLSVQEYLNASPRENPFRDNKPGRKWLQSFLKRHPEIVHRTPEAVTNASACVAQEDIVGWFSSVEKLLEEEGLLDILDDPTRIFNGDETGFNLCPKKGKVLAKKGTNNVLEVDCAQAKSSITVMFSFSASGDLVPPMIVYPYKRVPREISDSVPDHWAIGRSDSGWMTSEVFFEYISIVFHLYLEEKQIKRPVPVLLFVDGHKSHLTYQLSELCSEIGIVLVALYPNATRILQPADVAAFKPLKESWKRVVIQWSHNNPGEQITKGKFAPLLNNALGAITKEILISGFRATGLYPWNSHAIDPSRYLGSSEKSNPNTDMNSPSFVLTHDMFSAVVGRNLMKTLSEASNLHSSNPYFKALIALNEAFSGRLPKHISLEVQKASPPFGEGCLIEQRPMSPEHGVEDLPNIHSTPPKSQHILQTPIENTEVSPINFASHSTGQQNRTSPTANTAKYSTNSHNELPSETFEGSPDRNVAQRSTAMSLKNLLIWPLTPKRKGKRTIKRMPYVLTSGLWKQMHKEEDDRKRGEALKKQERARAREEKKNDKDAQNQKKNSIKRASSGKPSTKSVKRLNFPTIPHKPASPPTGEPQMNFPEPDDDEIIPLSPRTAFFEGSEHNNSDEYPGLDRVEFIQGLCFLCGGAMSRSNSGIQCDICEKRFHKTCIPMYDKKVEIVSCTECDRMASEMEVAE